MKQNSNQTPEQAAARFVANGPSLQTNTDRAVTGSALAFTLALYMAIAAVAFLVLSF